MLEDFRKSIRLVLGERLSSPLSGAFFFAWFVWNWKALYYLLYPSDNFSLRDRLDYAERNLLNWDHSLFYPALSAAFLILLYPFLTTGALLIWLKFRKWQGEIRNKVERSQLLTLEQSIDLRIAIEHQRDELDQLMRSKNEEIELLREQNDALRAQLSTATPEPTRFSVPAPSPSVNIKELEDFFSNQTLVELFPKVVRLIQSNIVFGTDSFPAEVIAYLVSHNIIEKKPGDRAFYEFTPKGTIFLAEFSNRQLSLGGGRNATIA